MKEKRPIRKYLAATDHWDMLTALRGEVRKVANVMSFGAWVTVRKRSLSSLSHSPRPSHSLFSESFSLVLAFPAHLNLKRKNTQESFDPSEPHVVNTFLAIRAQDYVRITLPDPVFTGSSPPDGAARSRFNQTCPGNSEAGGFS